MSELAKNAYRRLQLTGPTSASLADLVSVGFSRREDDVEANEASAIELIRKYGKVHRFRDLAAHDLTESFGLEGFENLKCMALIEIGRRTAGSGRGHLEFVESPEDAVELLSAYRLQKKEFFLAILLDAKNTVLRVAEVHIGTLTMSLVGPREVFREAIREGASSVIVAHNHPSGDPTPSPEDHSVTKKLRDLGDMLDIPVLDHLVIGERYAVSVVTGGRIGG
jgi:DNA repair protein RadC